MEPKELLKLYKLDDTGRRMKVVHYDSFPILKNDAHSGSMKKTDEGFLEGSAPVAKEGVMVYLLADGSILREFTPKEVLSDSAGRESLRLRPVTNNHPSELFVDSFNASFRQIGMTGEQIEMADEFLMANLVITDDITVEAVENGKDELSPGYEAEIFFEQGEFNGQQFDAIQVSRRYNHLAVVDNARGGMDIQMKLDSKKAQGYHEGAIKIKKEDSKSKPTQKENRSMKTQIDGIEYEADPEVLNALKKQTGRADAAEANLKIKTDESDKATAERDTQKEELDKLKKTDHSDAISKAVKERVTLVAIANDAFNGDEEKLKGLDDLSNRDLKVKIITDQAPTIGEKIDDKTGDVYLDAVLDTLEIKKEKKEDGVGGQRQEITAPAPASKGNHVDRGQTDGNRNTAGDNEKDPVKAAQLRMQSDSQNAWKQKPTLASV